MDEKALERIVKVVIGLAIGYLLVGPLFRSVGFGKYEGQTAEFWYDAYDEATEEYEELYECVQSHPITAGRDCL